MIGSLVTLVPAPKRGYTSAVIYRLADGAGMRVDEMPDNTIYKIVAEDDVDYMLHPIDSRYTSSFIANDPSFSTTSWTCKQDVELVIGLLKREVKDD